MQETLAARGSGRIYWVCCCIDSAHPQDTLLATATRSPGFRVLTSGPTSSTAQAAPCKVGDQQSRSLAPSRCPHQQVASTRWNAWGVAPAGGRLAQLQHAHRCPDAPNRANLPTYAYLHHTR